MNEYINKRDLLDCVDNFSLGLTRGDIERFPTADVVEVKHGEWIEQENYGYVCSSCGKYQFIDDDGKRDFHFCPNCGADMREGKESNG